MKTVAMNMLITFPLDAACVQTLVESHERGAIKTDPGVDLTGALREILTPPLDEAPLGVTAKIESLIIEGE